MVLVPISVSNTFVLAFWLESWSDIHQYRMVHVQKRHCPSSNYYITLHKPAPSRNHWFRCRVKSCNVIITLVLHKVRVVQHMHDICAVHFRWNSMHSPPKLLTVKWLGLCVKVRVRDKKWTWFLFFIFAVLKSDKYLCLALLAWVLVRCPLIPRCHLWWLSPCT